MVRSSQNFGAVFAPMSPSPPISTSTGTLILTIVCHVANSCGYGITFSIVRVMLISVFLRFEQNCLKIHHRQNYFKLLKNCFKKIAASRRFCLKLLNLNVPDEKSDPSHVFYCVICLQAGHK